MRRLVSSTLAWLVAAMLAWTISPAIMGPRFRFRSSGGFTKARPDASQVGRR